MMPDVALTTIQSPVHDLVLVEGKDRYRMPIKSLQCGALEVGRKYSQASGAAFTWITNYSQFSTTTEVSKRRCCPSGHGAGLCISLLHQELIDSSTPLETKKAETRVTH
jgi:hypothetical protein